MIKFGTSGFRGIMGDNFTKESVQRVAFSISKVVLDNKWASIPIAIGYDNRFMSKDYAKWMVEILIAYGIKVEYYTNPVPSTLIAFSAKNRQIGIMLTASHNPYYYNGVKIFINGGCEPDKAFTDKIEEFANNCDYSKIKSIDYVDGVKQAKIVETNAIKPYCDFMINYFDKKVFKNYTKRVLFNAMHGSTVECMNYITKKLGLKNFNSINDSIDPYFEYKLPAPYKQNLIDQANIIKKEKYDLGFAFDGDGDRITFIDKTGEIYDSNYASVVIYYYLVKYKNFKGGLVKNTALTSLTTKVTNLFGYKTFNANVGFKNIAKIMKETDGILGVESNGMCMKGHILHKDGLFFALMMMEALEKIGKSFGEIIQELKKICNFPCQTLEFAYEITQKQKDEINKKLFIDKKLPKFQMPIQDVWLFDGCKIIFENDYWCQIRFSGNEMVVRIFAEGKDINQCQEFVKTCEDFIGVHDKQ